MTDNTDRSTDEAPRGKQIAFYVYGIGDEEIDHAWWMPGEYDDADPAERPDREPDPDHGYDHEAHEAATLVMDALKERFDWAEDITGVGMGVREEHDAADDGHTYDDGGGD